MSPYWVGRLDTLHGIGLGLIIAGLVLAAAYLFISVVWDSDDIFDRLGIGGKGAAVVVLVILLFGMALRIFCPPANDIMYY